MSDVAIKVENISKKYQIGENKTYPTLRDKLMELPNLLFKGPKKNKEFWALHDVSFEIKKGEVVGIIGRNGAGKSTLLKILAHITEPTSGKITMYGRVASMLEVGTGFNPELTGRENIYLNGAIIGMTKKEINQKFNDIVEFSGVDKFLDTPVKHYSSGMYVRLAFAVAAHLDADILLVDEVLAVGDAEFQKKCLGKMSDLANSGKTVIFVSHNISAIENMCMRAIYLENGQTKLVGDVQKIISLYQRNGGEFNRKSTVQISKKLLKLNNIEITKICLSDADTESIDNLSIDSNIRIQIEYIVKTNLDKLGFTILVKNYATGNIIFSSISNSEKNWYKRILNKGSYATQCIIPGNLLNNSTYRIDICTYNRNFSEFVCMDNAIIFSLKDSDAHRYDFSGIYSGEVRPLIHWNTIKKESTHVNKQCTHTM